MTLEVVLRPATLVDCDLLAAMNRELIHDEGSRNPLSIVELSDRMYRWLQGDWQAMLILTGQVVVGYALYQIRPDEYHPQQTEVYLRHYFVRAVFRGQGIGTAAFAKLQADVFPPAAPVVLDVLATNPAARYFWQRLGFGDYAEHLRKEPPAMDRTLQDQIDYYRARAGEYDEWFYRKGRYDHGDVLNQQWFDEAQAIMQRLTTLSPVNTILELACGTGIWTEQLLKIGQHVTAIDAAPEVIAINRQKLDADNITYIQADLFQWEPEYQYDLVFFSFWLSHVPADQLDGFLAKVARATRPGGHLFIVDSQRTASSTAQDHVAYELDNPRHVRKLNDGREFEIYKIFYSPDELQAHLATHGFTGEALTTPNYFIYAHATRR